MSRHISEADFARWFGKDHIVDANKKVPKPKKKRSKALEDSLAELIKRFGLPAPVREYQFSPTRKFRWDFAWVDQKLGVEVQGGIWINGGHSRGSGQLRDNEKQAEAAALGWRFFNVASNDIKEGRAIAWIERCLRP